MARTTAIGIRGDLGEKATLTMDFRIVLHGEDDIIGVASDDVGSLAATSHAMADTPALAADIGLNALAVS